MTRDAAGDGRPAPDRELDVRGLGCPIPLLRTRVVLGEMTSGERLRVETTDPHSAAELKAFCTRAGHRFLHHGEAGGVHTFVLRRA